MPNNYGAPGGDSSPWVKRTISAMCCPATHASITRFTIEVAAQVQPEGCIEDCGDMCTDCAERGREFQVFCRLAIGPALKQEGRPDKRGVRLDSWCGMTNEPSAQKYEGALIDEGNEVIMEHGTTVMMKIPRLEDDDVTACPGFAVMIEWEKCEDGDHHDMLVMPMSAMPVATMLVSPVNYKHLIACPCPNPEHIKGTMAETPSFVPKKPPAPVRVPSMPSGVAKRKRANPADDDKGDKSPSLAMH